MTSVNREFILSVDGGGTRTRSAVVDREGRLLGYGEGGPSNHFTVQLDVVARSLQDAMESATAQLDRSQIVCVSAGMAGIELDQNGAGPIEEIFHSLGFARTFLTGDIVVAHMGALAGQTGVVALAGTGSSILGISPQGEMVKVGGWGPIYGDEGSAYRVGRLALEAAARAYDQYGPDTVLVDLIVRELRLNDFGETVRHIYAEGTCPRDIAKLCRVANLAAESGDQVALEIFHEQADLLANAVRSAIRRIGLENQPVQVSYQGGVLESCTLMRDRFRDALLDRAPQALLHAPRFNPVIGAFLFGAKSLGWPMEFPGLDTLKQEQANHSEDLTQG